MDEIAKEGTSAVGGKGIPILESGGLPALSTVQSTGPTRVLGSIEFGLSANVFSPGYTLAQRGLAASERVPTLYVARACESLPESDGYL